MPTWPEGHARSGSSEFRKRLLIVTQDFGGGTGRHLSAMIRRWAAAGWSVEVVCQGHATSEMVRGLQLVHGHPRTLLHRFPIAQVRKLRQIRREVATFVPDVVHCFFFWSIVLGRILKRAGLIHRLVENREDQGFSLSRLHYSVLRQTRHLPDRVICVADAVASVVSAREGLLKTQLRVIRNGIEPLASRATRDTARRALGLSPQELIVGAVANLNRPVKGLQYLIAAAPRIVEAVPQARIVLVGDGRLRRGLEAQARASGVADRILFTGYQEDVAPWYAALDVSVLTSLSEGLAITLLESMQHGLPVVATDVGGNREVVEDGVTGFLVAARDVDAVARRLVQLLSDAPLRRAMGNAGRAAVAERFDADLVARQYLQVYEGLVGG